MELRWHAVVHEIPRNLGIRADHDAPRAKIVLQLLIKVGELAALMAPGEVQNKGFQDTARHELVDDALQLGRGLFHVAVTGVRV